MGYLFHCIAMEVGCNVSESLAVTNPQVWNVCMHGVCAHMHWHLQLRAYACMCDSCSTLGVHVTMPKV